MSWQKIFDRVRENSLVYMKKKCENEKVEEQFTKQLLEDVNSALETIYSDGDDAYPKELLIDYLVHASLWDMFEYFPRYLDKFLPGAETSPFKKDTGNRTDQVESVQPMPERLHKLFCAIGKYFNEREIYTIVIAEISSYRNSVLLEDFLEMLRVAMGKIRSLQRDKFILDCANTIASCLRCRAVDSYTGVARDRQALPAVYQLGEESGNPELPKFDKTVFDEIDSSKEVEESVDLEAPRKHLYHEEYTESVEIQIGSKLWAERATYLLEIGLQFFASRQKGEEEDPSPFAKRLSTKVRRSLTSVILVLFEPWIFVDFDSSLISRKTYNLFHELLKTLVAHGMTFEEIFLEKERYMPWTKEGIAKGSANKDSKGKYFFLESNNEPAMEPDSDSDGSEDELGERKRKYNLSTNGGATVAYLISVAENAKTNTFAPKVYSTLYTLRLFIPHVRFMLQSEADAVRKKGFEVTSWLVNSIAASTIECVDLEDIDQLRGKNPSPTEDGAYLAFAEAMVTFTCTVQDKGLRSKSWALFVKYVRLFSEDSSFYLLGALIRHCPYKNVVGLLFDIVLANVQQAWASIPPGSTDSVKPKYHQMSTKYSLYASPQLTHLLWNSLSNIREEDFYDSLEVHCSILSIFRFILLRDKRSDFCNLWPDMAKKTKNILEPMRRRVADSIDARTKDANAAKHQSVATNLHLEGLRLNLLLDSLDRLVEIITEDERYKLLT